VFENSKSYKKKKSFARSKSKICKLAKCKFFFKYLCKRSLLDCRNFTVTYRKKPSKILFILFTVNYCNMHCIVGIFNEIYSNLLYMGICSILLVTQKQ